MAILRLLVSIKKQRDLRLKMSRWILPTRRLFRGAVWLDMGRHLPHSFPTSTRATENSPRYLATYHPASSAAELDSRS